MITTLLRTVPPPIAVFLFGFLYIILVGVGYVESRFGWLDGYNGELAKAVLILASGVIYGGMRVWACFPLSNQSFYRWFKTTPWQPGMPMPFGFMYMHLNWADAIAPSILFAIEWDNPYLHAIWMLAAFLLGYLAVHVSIFEWSKDHFLNYILAFGLGLFVWALQFSGWAVLVLVGMYAIAVWGHRRVLDGFPWPDEMKPEKYGEKRDLKKDPGADIGATYPISRQPCLMKSYFEVLSPARPAEISISQAIANSLLIGWLIFVPFDMVFGCYLRMTIATDHLSKLVVGMFVAVAVIAPFMRTCYYVADAHSPLGLEGRILTGQLIIPRHDVIYLSPLAYSAMGSVIFFALLKLGAYEPLCLALGVATLTLGLCCAKPSQIEWRLTGHNRPRFRLSLSDRQASN